MLLHASYSLVSFGQNRYSLEVSHFFINIVYRESKRKRPYIIEIINREPNE